MLVVYIDCGHNEKSIGAVSYDKSIQEYQYVRKIASHLKALISLESGIKLAYIYNKTARTGETENQDINNRVRLFNRAMAQEVCNRGGDRHVLISIHCDSSMNGTASGMSVFTAPVCSSIALDLAVVSEHTIEEYHLNGNRLLAKNKYLTKKRDIAILRDTVCPAVLYECMFLSNPEDVEFLKKPTSPENIARCIFTSLLKYKELCNQ